MPRRPTPPLGLTEHRVFANGQIEDSEKISQEQLTNAKIFHSREEYAKNFKKGIRYLEVGVAWGYSAQMFIDSTEAISADLVDWFDQDLRCWSWRKFGSCQCQGMKHELLYTPKNHQSYIIEKFKKYFTRSIIIVFQNNEKKSPYFWYYCSRWFLVIRIFN